MTDDRTGGTCENAYTTHIADSARTPHGSHTTRTQAVDHHAIGFDADRALAPHRTMPPAHEIDDLTTRLVGHGARLVDIVESIPENGRTVRAKGALKDWYDLTENGPGDGAMADWVHMRAMARTCRTFMDYLRERGREAASGQGGLGA